MRHIVPGEVYRAAETDLQLPRSHLAFRIPRGATGRLGANGAFKIFSADRRLSCFVFVHGADGPLTLYYEDNMYSQFRYHVEGDSLMLTPERREVQLWSRG